MEPARTGTGEAGGARILPAPALLSFFRNRQFLPPSARPAAASPSGFLVRRPPARYLASLAGWCFNSVHTGASGHCCVGSVGARQMALATPKMFASCRLS
jgi:hypothetical protein